jgi:hypothetical protein
MKRSELLRASKENTGENSQTGVSLNKKAFICLYSYRKDFSSQVKAGTFLRMLSSRS